MIKLFVKNFVLTASAVFGIMLLIKGLIALGNLTISLVGQDGSKYVVAFILVVLGSAVMTHMDSIDNKIKEQNNAN